MWQRIEPVADALYGCELSIGARYNRLVDISRWFLTIID
jgi:hypothetical protein